jgi:hypothetical protein
MINLKAYRNDTFEEVEFTVKRSTDGNVTRNPIDITGATLLLEVKKKKSTPSVLSMTIANDKLEIVDGPGGVLIIKEQIIDIPGDIYYFDLQISFTDNRKKTWIRGYLTVIEDVSKTS